MRRLGINYGEKLKCKRCGLSSNNKEDYVPTYRKENQYRNYCWKCWRIKSKKYREKFRNKRRQILRDAKNKPCIDCGNKYPYYVMDFDHIGDDKNFTIGDGWFNASLNEIKQEIKKCQIVCANCHRIRTHKRNKS